MDSHAYAHGYGYDAGACGGWHAHGYRYAYGERNRYGNGYSAARGVSQEAAHADAEGNGYVCDDCEPDGRGNCYAYAGRNAYPDADGYALGDVDADACEYGDGDAGGCADADACCHCGRYLDAGCRR